MSIRFTSAELATGAERFLPPLVAGPIVGEHSINYEAAPTASTLAELHKQAHEEGFQQGHAEGLQRAARDMQTRMNRLDSVLGQLMAPLAAVDEAVVEAVADLAVLVARHLVRRELKTNPGEVVGVVRETMRHLPVTPRAARIRLHPEDAELVESAFALGDDAKSWRLEPDPLVTRGGCIVETDSSRIDASVESRLAAIASKMLGGEREGDRAR